MTDDGIQLDLHVALPRPGDGAMMVTASLPGTQMCPVCLEIVLKSESAHVIELWGNSAGSPDERPLRSQGIGTLLMNTAIMFLWHIYPPDAKVTSTEFYDRKDVATNESKGRRQQRLTFWRKHGMREDDLAIVGELRLRKKKVFNVFNAYVPRSAFREVAERPPLRIQQLRGMAPYKPKVPRWLLQRQPQAFVNEVLARVAKDNEFGSWEDLINYCLEQRTYKQLQINDAYLHEEDAIRTVLAGVKCPEKVNLIIDDLEHIYLGHRAALPQELLTEIGILDPSRRY